MQVTKTAPTIEEISHAMGVLLNAFAAYAPNRAHVDNAQVVPTAAYREEMAGEDAFGEDGPEPDMDADPVCGAPALDRLSAEELMVVRLAAAGLTNEQIAARLMLAEAVVKMRIRSAMTKLRVDSRVHFVALFPPDHLNASGRPEIAGRELQVLRRVAAGDSNKQIARLLGITEATVKVHLKSIFRKLGVPNRSSAACAAISFGIAQPQFTPEQEIKAKNFAAKAGAEA